MSAFKDPKFIIAYTLILGFFGAYIHNPDATMNGALIGAFAGAWGYYLGSSNSTNEARAQVGQALHIAKQAGGEPDVILKAGETAQAEDN